MAMRECSSIISPVALFAVLNASLDGPKMGTRALKFIPNTPTLVAWGLKPTTCHLSELINSRTKVIFKLTSVA